MHMPFQFLLVSLSLVVLVDAWESCQGADVLLESPSAMAGVHIAEALREFYLDCSSLQYADLFLLRHTIFPHIHDAMDKVNELL